MWQQVASRGERPITAFPSYAAYVRVSCDACYSAGPARGVRTAISQPRAPGCCRHRLLLAAPLSRAGAAPWFAATYYGTDRNCGTD